MEKNESNCISKPKSIKKNFEYNVIYNVLLIILPLITTPYISRVIGPSGSGTYSYTYSVANYFVLFAMLGINNYGNRLIAKSRDDSQKLSINFTSLFFLHVIISILIIAIYIVFSFFLVKKYQSYFIIQGINIVAALFDINWLFFGLEDFKTTVTRNIIVKIITVVFIFTFVNSSNDLLYYILILNCSNLLSQLLLFPFLKKNNVKFVKVSYKDIIVHFKPILLLFFPVIAVSLYKIMDKIMLGYMVNVTELGYYEYAERIINLPMTLITALGTVMMPRISNLVSKGNNKAIYSYISKSIRYMLFIAIPLCFGLIVVSNNFIPIFLGDKFFKTSELIYYLAPTIPIISFSNVIQTQYMLPKNKDRYVVFAVSIGAIVNIFINILTIPKLGCIGASIATFFAELSVLVYECVIFKKELYIKDYFKSIFPFFWKSLLMTFILLCINFLNFDALLTLVVQINVGVIIYGLLNLKILREVFNGRDYDEKKH